MRRSRGVAVLKSWPRLYRAARAVRLRMGALLPPRRIAGLDGRVHRNDLMLAGERSQDLEHYVQLGLEAVAALERSCLACGREIDSLREVLDLGSGYGRVLRALRRRLPNARITACDIDRWAIRFCESEFGAVPLLSSGSFDSVGFGSYDVMWIGSLLTHLPVDRWHGLVARFPRLLNPGGIVIFTTHGKVCLDRLGDYFPGLSAERRALESELDSSGIAFRPYPHHRGNAYGVTFHDSTYVTGYVQEATDGQLGLVSHATRGWDAHQDVFAFVRMPPP